jgi:hypothetical protein
MTQVKIKGLLRHHHGVPQAGNAWSGAPIFIEFHGYSQTATEQRPSDRAQITTNADGTWQHYAWKNSEGDYTSYYTFKFPYGDPIKVVLADATPAEIEFSQLAIASTPPDAPNYPSLIAIINDQLASSGVAFPAGGTAGQALVITQTAPRLFGWVDATGDLVKPGAIALSGHKVVYVSASGVNYANSRNIATRGLAVGVTVGASSLGADATIRTRGEIIEPSWAWTPALPVFLGQDGALSQSGPAPPDLFSQIVGMAISATSIYVNIQPPIVLG